MVIGNRTLDIVDVVDDATGEVQKLLVEADRAGVYIVAVGNPEVYVAIEVADGVLRAAFGPRAEVQSLDGGILVGEPIDPEVT